MRLGALAAALLLSTAGLASAETVAAGRGHTLLVLPDGTVVAWGDNGSGQLGDGTTAARSTAAPVGGLAGIVSVAAGDSHSLALDANGVVYAWGGNARGQLGDGSREDRLTPVVVGSGFAGVAAAVRSSFAWTTAGEVYAWGANPEQVLGRAGAQDRLRPARSSRLPGLVSVAARDSHALGLGADGFLYAWGRNDHGQLGDGTWSSRSEAEPVVGLTQPTAFAAGHDFSLAVLETGQVLAWGSNAGGQLGHDEPESGTPLRVPGVEGALEVGAGLEHAAALLGDGAVWSWGSNQLGQLGDGTGDSRAEARAVEGLPPIAALAVGDLHTIAVGRDGSVWAWGANDRSQLGDGTSEDRWAPVEVAGPGFEFRTATPVFRPASSTTDRELDVFVTSATPGADVRYRLGEDVPTPSDAPVSPDTPVHLDRPAQLTARAWKEGRLPSAPASAAYLLRPAPPQMSPAPGTYADPVDVALTCSTPGAVIRYTTDGSEPHAESRPYAQPIHLGETGTLRAAAFRDGWASGPVATATYRIGTGGGVSATGPSSLPGGVTAMAAASSGQGTVAAGHTHSVALTSTGDVWTWGLNNYGQLGDGTTTQRKVPTQVTALSGMTAIAAGQSHTAAVKSDGTVWTWGRGTYGRLGNGSATTQKTPVQATGITGAIDVEAGSDHTIVLKSDGTVWSFGYNNYGQLGDTTTTYRMTAVQVSGLTNVVSISARRYGNVAVESDGTVWRWGKDGILGWTSTPVQVSGLTGIASAGIGWDHSHVVASDSTLWAWGVNSYGRLGDGTTTSKSTPVSLASPAAASVSGGQLFSLAATTAGGVEAWGFNGNGQLGNGTTTQSTTPVPTTGLTGIVAVSAGQNFALAVSGTGEVWAWGYNNYGQVGDGTTTQRLSPVKLADAGFSWLAAVPNFSPGGGTYNVPKTVTLTSETPGTTIHYTTDGTAPDETDPSVPNGGSVLVDTSLTLKARAYHPSQGASGENQATYTLYVATPTLSPGGGTFADTPNVTVSTTSPGATLHYTTDGTDPDPADPTIASGTSLLVSESLTLKVRGYRSGWDDSAVRTGTYNLVVATPALIPPGGSYSGAQTVSVTTATPGATIHYTTDGSEPTPFAPVLAGGSVEVATSLTLKVLAVRSDFQSSPTVTESYVIDLGTAAPPTLTPPGGTYAGAQSVTMTAPASVIRYTTDGTDPTLASPVYAGPVPVGANAIVKARAYRDNYAASSVTAETYTIGSAVTPPSLDPPGGFYTVQQTVTLTSPTVGVAIHYTTDGTAPDASDPSVASGGTVLVDKAMTLRAVAIAGPDVSTEARGDYAITGAVSGGERHSLALQTDGTLLAWGGNQYGELGDGTTTSRASPAAVTALSDVAFANAGYYMSAAVERDGTVWTWGRNTYGGLGNGTTADSHVPVEVVGVSGVVSVASGYWHVIALEADGTVVSWGGNGEGQLGIGNRTNSSSPVSVPGLTDIVAVAAGGNQSRALDSQGRIWVWGDNAYGGLGLGNTTDQLSPVLVDALPPARSTSASLYSSMNVVSGTGTAGPLWGAGRNNFGELGDGTTIKRTTSVSWSGWSAAAAVSAGSYQAFALTPEGRVWAMGFNGAGALGDGTTDNRSGPVRVLGVGALVAIESGDSHTLGIRDDGQVVGWGNNGQLQLGTGQEPLPGEIPSLVLGDHSWFGGDADGDGLTNLAELSLGLDLMNADTNDNGIADGDEHAQGLDPGLADSDGDGLSNSAERLLGTDPLDPDSDGDGVADGSDAAPLDPGRWDAAAIPGDTTGPVITLTDPAAAVPVP